MNLIPRCTWCGRIILPWQPSGSAPSPSTVRWHLWCDSAALFAASTPASAFDLSGPELDPVGRGVPESGRVSIVRERAGLLRIEVSAEFCISARALDLEAKRRLAIALAETVSLDLWMVQHIETDKGGFYVKGGFYAYVITVPS